MKNIAELESEVLVKIKRKCSEYNLNYEIFAIDIVQNMIIITVTHAYPFVDYVWFKGEKKNDIGVMLNIEEYLNDVIPKIFISERKPEKEELDEFDIDEYDQYD